MVFGLLKDIKAGENRVMATPAEIKTIVNNAHTALVQKGAGEASGFTDASFEKAGAVLVDTAKDIYAKADFVVKVKEIEPQEFDMLREGLIVYSCLHPAAHPEEVQALLKNKVISFTAEDGHRHGSPNGEAAGKQGALFGLESMLTTNGGKGKFVGGFAGAPGMNVLILGGGIVGRGALEVLHALGANVTLMDVNYGTMKEIRATYGNDIKTMLCTKETIESVLPQIDMVVNCVKWPKERKDFLIDKEMLTTMEPGSVLVDISNDDPGAIESSHETFHDNPRYVVNGVVHFCVSNIPSAVANSTSVSYASEAFPLLLSVLNDGVAGACIKDGYLRRSLTTYKGILTHEETSRIQNIPWMRPEDALEITGQRLDPAPPATNTRSDNFVTK